MLMSNQYNIASFLMLFLATVNSQPVKKDAKSMSHNDIEFNSIPGSSDYVPETVEQNNSTTTTMKIATSIDDIKNSTNKMTINLNTTTMSNANVFNSTAVQNITDPLISNAQSPNPQIAMILRNNPRLQMLARQNPIIAQQIMQNPGLLRDPAIQRAIQSQLSSGQQQNLLGQLGQMGMGLGRALNPFGLPIGGLGGGQGMNQGGLGQSGSGMRNNDMNRLGNRRSSPGFGNANNLGQQQRNQNNLNAFGLPQGNHAMSPRNQDTLRGGYYGNNGNYNNQPAGGAVDDGSGGGEGNEAEGGEGGEGGETENDINGDGGGQEENANQDAGNQDYDGSSNGDGGGSDDGQQNPAEDPDIQQLQNFGGPVSDNFPEGLFPPGLLSKEDIEEIRKQQEKQQKEEQEKQRREQEQQQGNQSPDYDNTGGEDGTGEPDNGAEVGGEEGATGGEDAANNENRDEVGTNTDNANNNQFSDTSVNTPNGYPSNGNINQESMNSAGRGGGFTTSTPPAFQNAYQPVQPNNVQQGYGRHHQLPLQPQVNYDQPSQPMQNSNPFQRKQTNYQSGVEYDQFNHKTPSSQPELFNTFNNQHSISNNPTFNQPHPQTNSLPNNHYQPNLINPMNRQNLRSWSPKVYYDNRNNPIASMAGPRYLGGNNKLFNNDQMNMANIPNTNSFNGRSSQALSPGAYPHQPNPLQHTNYPIETPNRIYQSQIPSERMYN